MVGEPSKVAGLRENGQRVDRPDPGDHAQELVIAVLAEHGMGAVRSISSRCRIRLRACAMTMRNMAIATESSSTGSANDAQAVS